MSFIARYSGECGQCGQEVKDTECAYADYDEKIVVHTGCLQDFRSGIDPAAALGRHERNCPECFTIHAGPCL